MGKYGSDDEYVRSEKIFLEYAIFKSETSDSSSWMTARMFELPYITHDITEKCLSECAKGGNIIDMNELYSITERKSYSIRNHVMKEAVKKDSKSPVIQDIAMMFANLNKDLTGADVMKTVRENLTPPAGGPVASCVPGAS